MLTLSVFKPLLTLRCAPSLAESRLIFSRVFTPPHLVTRDEICGRSLASCAIDIAMNGASNPVEDVFPLHSKQQRKVRQFHIIIAPAKRNDTNLLALAGSGQNQNKPHRSLNS